MDIIEITDENLEFFSELLGEDLSADMKRAYFGGVGATDPGGSPVGALVYEVLNSESEEDTKSRIAMIKSDSMETADALDHYYAETSIEEDEVVESFYELENEPEARLLSEIGFSFEKKEDDNIIITLDEVSQSALGQKRKLPDRVGSIESLEVMTFRDAIKQILFKGYSGLMEDIPFLPKSWYDNSISSCISSGGKITGLFLVRRTPSGVLIPVFYFAYGPEYQKDLVYMLWYSAEQALKICPRETQIKIARKSKATRALTDKLMPERAGAEIFFGERKEQ